MKLRRAFVVYTKPIKRLADRRSQRSVQTPAVLTKTEQRWRRDVIRGLENQARWNDSWRGSLFNDLKVDLGSMEADIESGVSIITLNLNAAHFIDKYLDGLFHLPSIPIELIFIDHNSNDKSVELVESYRNRLPIDIKIVRKQSNDRYSTSNNEGLKLACHNNILLLNNDVVLTNQSRLDVALRLIKEESSVGLIGWNLYYDYEYAYRQHRGVGFSWDVRDRFYRPTNIAGLPEQGEIEGVREYPAVTAAMVLTRKSDLLAIGGFDEDFNYGFEDVDLSLRFKTELGKSSVVIDGLNAIHEESTSQNRENKFSVSKRRQNNARHFQSKFSTLLGHAIRQSLFGEKNLRLNKLTVGFVVTEAFDGATAGDYFTALEFSEALRLELNCNIRFFSMRGPGSGIRKSCSGIDFLIVMVDRFDPRELEDRTANTVVVAWMRNWFDRWQSWDYSGLYDYYLSSSEFASEFTSQNFGISNQVMRIATNANRFFTDLDTHRDIDICFVGSKWGVEREIESVFPVLQKYNCQIFGHGWEDDGSGMFQGGLPYAQVPSIYSRSKIVIDDAASSTKQWCSVNSRVFDALAAGCLVITNGTEGVLELSGASDQQLSLPSFSNAAELDSLLNAYLSDDILRKEASRKFQKVICEQHTYRNRAREFASLASDWLAKGLKIAIKVAAPSEAVKHQWGDYHFADSLRMALMRHGHAVRIDLLPDWDSEIALHDEVVIVLRGLSRYPINPAQVNVMWNISHPDKVTDDEYSEFDAVFLASNSYVNELRLRLPDQDIRPLLQCTDPYRFYRDEDKGVPKHEFLFVGNSRRVFRDTVKFSIEANLPISVYGGLWDGLIDSKFVKAENIPNKILRKYYSNAGVVLNDHWDSMRKNGFISNRLFDITACGGVAVTDEVMSMEGVFGNNIITYDGTSAGFKEAIKKTQQLNINKDEIADWLSENSFDARAKEILKCIEKYKHKKLTRLTPSSTALRFDSRSNA